jgi:hypothetical protein
MSPLIAGPWCGFQPERFTVMANQPNMYSLDGGGIHATYSTTSFQGKPLFTYHDAVQFKNFSGDEIKVLETDIGTLVTVVIHITIDRGSTTFSLLLPHVNLGTNTAANITAIGVTTLNRFPLIPIPGQTQSYTVYDMQGTASLVKA